MTRVALVLGMLALTLTCSPSQAQTAQEPVFDDRAYHPFILPRGSLEYEHALQRKQAQPLAPAIQWTSLADALKRCDVYSSLSQATREKCELRARQTAARIVSGGAAAE